MEQDADERAKRRTERETKGRELKGEGNAAFRSGQYDIAVARYAAALENTPWDTSLYTNRAQVCVCDCIRMLHEYSEVDFANEPSVANNAPRQQSQISISYNMYSAQCWMFS